MRLTLLVMCLTPVAVAVVLRRGCVGTRAVRRRALARGGRLGGGGRSTGRSCGVHVTVLVVVAGSELQKSARANRGIGRGSEC